MEPYIFHPQAIVRIPRLPYNFLIPEADVRLLFDDPIFLESIFLASPILYRECIKYRAGKMKDEKDIQKLKNSVIKYYLRSTGRSTPFGLFSGCCVGEWQEAVTKLFIGKKNSRHTRLD